MYSPDRTGPLSSPKGNERGVALGRYPLKRRHAPLARLPHAVHAGAVIGAVWAAGLATQYVAARLAYHPNLGPWLYRASPSARARFGLAVLVCGIAAGVALFMRRWRWGVVPLVLTTVSAMILRDAPLYSPGRVFVWYKAYHAVPAYRHLFLAAWGIFAVATIAATVAAVRLAATRPEPLMTEDRRPDRYFRSDIII